MTLLLIRNVSKTYTLNQGWQGRKAITALQNVSLTISPGCCLGLVGESGSGKSTLGRVTLGLEKPDSGEIWFQGKDISRLKNNELNALRRDMQVVFQDSFSAVNPQLKAREIIAEPINNYLRISPTETRDRVAQLLEKVGLTAADAEKYPHQFSGGQLQRITIARAIALNPKFIVLDEPVASLDMTIQAQILDLLLSLKREFNLAYLFISHDLAAVSFISDALAVMYEGAIVEHLGDVNRMSELQHPYSIRLMASQLPAHPRYRLPILHGDDNGFQRSIS
ncbi:ABC transporter ATP-binding protein [Oculatella sp. LEGE 06141]|uniref:ATP-binding cassette domain-containing protein n=1 Tax=Oculatella sp. LEGE 06141 TaxID=1828648 RepID=UPI0018814F3F|nr:dipeptide/oligopeptide/nickel ABC transporter ATP-binding protein [Oculatella sp. LEGE 06141]MBE9178140.1 ABC transporter ATP-binding protein [Oculatella sp. LEGE 06141]